MSVLTSIPQIESQVKNELHEVLEMADGCLDEYRTAWARFVATGDSAAYIAAVAAWEDREQLLGKVSLCHKT